MKQVKGWGVAWQMKLPDNKVAKGIIKRRNRTECERLIDKLSAAFTCKLTITSITKRFE
jgi:hypothetical protein